jgi:hypothetical protein
LRALPGKRYAVLRSPLYVYREPGSATLEKVSSALDYSCSVFGKQLCAHPVESAIEIAKARGKQLIYHSAAMLGLWDHMIRRRSRIPTAPERRQYQDAWQIVSKMAALSALTV